MSPQPSNVTTCDSVNIAANPVLAAQYQTVDAAMFTLSQVVTFDGWGDIVWELHENPAVMFGVLVFLVIAGLGIMNIIVGIMCESAMEVTRGLREKRERAWLLKAKQSIAEVR